MLHNFYVDRFVHFFDYVQIDGWVLTESPVEKIVLVSPHLLAGKMDHGLPSPDLGGAGDHARFSGRYLVDKSFDCLKTKLAVFEKGSDPVEINHADMLAKMELVKNPYAIDKQFRDLVQASEYARLVEIGSRARSGVIRDDIFQGKHYTGVDVVPGVNVDLVADAHRLSQSFEADSVDAVFSLNTFEHLAMPLQVVLEMNTILRVGGLVYLEAPQTIGLHELPWDFFRFSDRAWESLLNANTGFEIIQAQMSFPTHIIPFFPVGGVFTGYEATAGNLSSAVLARKTGKAKVRLEADFSQTTFGSYPA